MPTLSLWNVSLGLATTPTVLSDINTYWMYQVYQSAQGITLKADAAATDNSITISTLTPGIGGYRAGLLAQAQITNGFRVQSSAGAPMLSVGSCVVIDQEPMTITAISGPDGSGNYLASVSRGQTQTTPAGATDFPLAVSTIHANGALVSILKYATPWEMVRVECLAPYALQIVQWMGLNSANLTSTINGNVTQ